MGDGNRPDAAEHRGHTQGRLSAAVAPECGRHYAAAQPSGLKTRWVDAGYFASIAAGRMGRLAKLPAQLGHFRFRTPSTQFLQKVHSNVQIIASGDSGGRSRSQ